MTISPAALADLNKDLRRIAKEAPEAVKRGAFKGGLLIQSTSQKNTPVEYGTLRLSAYTKFIPNGVEVGYTSEYALFVHENMEQKLAGLPRPSGLGTYWNPGGPKFLENAIDEHADDVMAFVEEEMAKVLGI